MVLKLAVLGLLGYLRDKANIFDGIIVTVSIVEVAIAPPLLLFPGTTSTPDVGCYTFALMRFFGACAV